MPLHPPRRRARRVGALIGASLALVLGLPGVATAAPGDLDPTFGGDGTVVTDAGYIENNGDVAVQPDGKIVTLGTGNNFPEEPTDFLVMRYNADGSLDTEFGEGDGIVLADLGAAYDDMGKALALQPDGKIIAVGSSFRSFGRWMFAVHRLNADGTPDTGFGTGGSVFTAFDDPSGNAQAEAVALQADGKIVVGGSSAGGFTLARYDVDGSLDTGFGGDGTVTTAFEGTGATVLDLAVQPDTGIVAGGYGAGGMAVARYHADGSLDTGFSGDGRASITFGSGTSGAEGIALQPDGRIVGVGAFNDAFAVVRFTADGAPDPTFDGNGRLTTSFGTGQTRAMGVVLQPDGRIVAAGYHSGEFALARYNTGGSLDVDFGGDGRVTTDPGTYTFYGNAVALQPDGGIVVSGDDLVESAVARYLGGGGVEPPTADLSVTKTGPATLVLGDQATYTIRVTNNSTATTATGVSLSDTLTGASGRLLSATPSQGGPCTVNPTTMSCTLGSIAPGASATVSVVAEPRTTGTLTDWVAIGAAEEDPVPANNNANAATVVNNSRGCTIVGTSVTETLNGTSGNDVICALSGNDTVYGNGGSDTVHAGAGSDWVSGGTGNDRLIGQSGGDRLNGDGGNDTLDTRDGIGGNDAAYGGDGSDTCTTDTGDFRNSCP
ncbi:calcium-binding protein [Streptomyces sp. NPDC051921]|uniref:calcium-binding protein n=1 Tax=Streptomyces sp. NPDC051921 TaxID=3155806 RepID=UPI0034374F66